MQENTITIGRVLREGWSCFKARPWFWIGVIVLCGVIADIIGLVSSMILEWVGPSAGSPEIGWSVAVVLILLGTFVQIRLQMGLLWMGVITVTGQRARFGDLFAKPHLFWRFLCASILFQLMVLVVWKRQPIYDRCFFLTDPAWKLGLRRFAAQNLSGAGNGPQGGL